MKTKIKKNVLNALVTISNMIIMRIFVIKVKKYILNSELIISRILIIYIKNVKMNVSLVKIVQIIV